MFRVGFSGIARFDGLTCLLIVRFLNLASLRVLEIWCLGCLLLLTILEV